MSIVFEDFEEFRIKLADWRKRDEFSLDVALWTEIELETLLAELPVPPFDDWIDGIGPGKYWGGYVGGKPFVIEFSDSRKSGVNFYWRTTPWPDDPLAWSFLDQIRDIPIQLIRPGLSIRNSWGPHVESIYLEGSSPFTAFQFQYKREFYRSGSRTETEGLLSFLSEWKWPVNWRIGPPIDRARFWRVNEIQADGTPKVVARYPQKEQTDWFAWDSSLNCPDSTFLVIRDDEKEYGIGVKNGQPLPDWPPKPSE